MRQHRNAKLGPAGRIELVRLIEEEELTERQAAACLSVAPRRPTTGASARRDASAAELRSGAWAEDRSSRPRRSPTRVPSAEEARICAARERLGWGPRLLAGEVGRPHSTVHAVLRRHERSRAPRRPKWQEDRGHPPHPLGGSAGLLRR